MNSNESKVISKKEWFTIDELAAMSVDGIRGSKATIHRKAVKGAWLKRQREGVKGVAFEYHISSFPREAQVALGGNVQHDSNVVYQEQKLEGKLLVNWLYFLSL
jgi:Mu DNA-binding domain.